MLELWNKRGRLALAVGANEGREGESGHTQSLSPLDETQVQHGRPL